MAAVQKKLVHKQFNSPIGLYSQQNVKETLDRELKAFGADGIEIDEQISKPLNLANSAVLRAVEEEDQMKCGYKRVAWPPVSEERIIREFTPQPQTPATQQESFHNQQQQLQQQSAKQQQPQQAAAPAQGPIYNNVQRQASPYPQQYQQKQYQQQPQARPTEQQPIQYTQSQYNRQPSREPAQQTTVPLAYQQPAEATSQNRYNPPNNYSTQQAPTAQQQQQPQYDPTYGSYQPNNARDGNSPYPGWKPIRPPTMKAQSQYHAQTPMVGAADSPYASAYPQQQYRATSYDRYQQPQQTAPQASAYQQPPQQVPHYQAPYQAGQPQQQQQQPSWTQQRPQQQQYQAPYAQGQYPSQTYPAQNSYTQSTPQQQLPLEQQQQQFYSSNPQVNYNSYSQPQQQQQQSHDQPDFQRPQQREQSLPQDYRGASPGIITLRKEAPISQKPAPVYTSQPAAVSYQGGSNMRGDLKWPPPEYKEAAARENDERRKVALGPVCRPRKVNRDYSNFFAKNALNSYYPSYKVPPGTQHMLF